MPQVNELASEIVAAIEIYFLGRGAQHYNNAAFILCDDYTELASKLFLLRHVPNWRDSDSDRMADYLMAKANVETAAQSAATVDALSLQIYQRGEPRGRFKNYHAILKEVGDVFQQSHPADSPVLNALHDAMKSRRDTRNNLVHTSGPLGMRVSADNCIAALCALLAYALLLFGAEWEAAAKRARRLETYALL